MKLLFYFQGKCFLQSKDVMTLVNNVKVKICNLANLLST